jgi:predicted nucleic acid-binding protein
MKAVFDTSILIDHMRNVSGAVEIVMKMEKNEVEGIISVLTAAELFAGDECSDKEKKDKILNFLKTFKNIEVTCEIAEKAGDFARKYKVHLSDCIIAATAFHQNCILWTKNAKDFEKIKDIRVEEPY